MPRKKGYVSSDSESEESPSSEEYSSESGSLISSSNGSESESPSDHRKKKVSKTSDNKKDKVDKSSDNKPLKVDRTRNNKKDKEEPPQKKKPKEETSKSQKHRRDESDEDDEEDSGEDEEFLQKISLDDLPEAERNQYMEKHKKWLDERLSEKAFVTISEPYKDGNFLKSYITYLISTNPWDTNVRRRFSDIEWLHDALSSRYPGILIDNMPSKKLINNQDPEFLDVRMKALERHINKILENPFLRKDNLMNDFLTLPPKEFEELKKTNTKSRELNIGGFGDILFSDNVNVGSLFKSKLNVHDKRPNEGYKEWTEYLRHLTAPLEIEKTLKSFSGKVKESVSILQNVISTLEQMVVRGTGYSQITRQFKENMGSIIRTNQETDLITLQTFEKTRKNHQIFIADLINLEKASRAWHELEFFQPQEVFPELMYEFQEQLEHLNGLSRLIDRRSAILDEFQKVWKIKDEKQYKFQSAKNNRNKPLMKKIKAEINDMEYDMKIIKFQLQQITKSLIYCEFDKFVEYRANTFHKTVSVFCRLQIVAAQRSQSTWEDLLTSIGETNKPELLLESQKRLANCCTVFDIDDEDDDISKSSASTSSNSSRSNSPKKQKKSDVKSNPNDIDL